MSNKIELSADTRSQFLEIVNYLNRLITMVDCAEPWDDAYYDEVTDEPSHNNDWRIAVALRKKSPGPLDLGNIFSTGIKRIFHDYEDVHIRVPPPNVDRDAWRKSQTAYWYLRSREFIAQAQFACDLLLNFEAFAEAITKGGDRLPNGDPEQNRADTLAARAMRYDIIQRLGL